MRPANLFRKLSRGPQVVLLKDAAFVSAFTGLQSGDTVVDAGAGSGWLAVYLASLVAPSGHVTSYEWRPEFADLAEKNVRKAGLESVATIKRASIFGGMSEEQVNLVALDLAGSAQALPHAFGALVPQGWCVGFCPNVEQAKEFVLAGEGAGFVHVKTVECDEREWLIRPHGCRPATTGLRHTSFLCFLQKPLARALKAESPAAPAKENP